MADGHEAVVSASSLDEATPLGISFDGSEVKPISASSGSEILDACPFSVNGKICDDKRGNWVQDVKLQMKAGAVNVNIKQHLPLLAEFAASVVSQVNQEQIVAVETSQNIVENPTVQEQVIVQKIPEVQVVERIQEQIVETKLFQRSECSSAPSKTLWTSPCRRFRRRLLRWLRLFLRSEFRSKLWNRSWMFPFHRLWKIVEVIQLVPHGRTVEHIADVPVPRIPFVRIDSERSCYYRTMENVVNDSGVFVMEEV